MGCLLADCLYVYGDSESFYGVDNSIEKMSGVGNFNVQALQRPWTLIILPSSRSSCTYRERQLVVPLTSHEILIYGGLDSCGEYAAYGNYIFNTKTNKVME